MLVVTRFRVAHPSSDPSADAAAQLRTGLEKARDILSAKPGALWAEVGRNLDDPELWVLSTRWADVGSYRRAIGSYEGKMHVQPLMVHALDEPSAYELVHDGTDLNEAGTRSLG